jgi:hypothetical protein
MTGVRWATRIDLLGAFRRTALHQLSSARATHAKLEKSLLLCLQAPLVDPICENNAMAANGSIDAEPDTAVPRHRLPPDSSSANSRRSDRRHSVAGSATEAAGQPPMCRAAPLFAWQQARTMLSLSTPESNTFGHFPGQRAQSNRTFWQYARSMSLTTNGGLSTEAGHVGEERASAFTTSSRCVEVGEWERPAIPCGFKIKARDGVPFRGEPMSSAHARGFGYLSFFMTRLHALTNCEFPRTRHTATHNVGGKALPLCGHV